MRLISPEYQDQLRRQHATTKWGTAGRHHADIVVRFATELGATSILDYGCGRGTLKPSIAHGPEITISEYDPGIPGKDVPPTDPVDLLVCTDVLEHVEPLNIDDTLAHMRALTRKGAFFIIALGPAKETLADGRNAHLLLRSKEWWRGSLIRHGFDVVRDENWRGYRVWCHV